MAPLAEPDPAATIQRLASSNPAMTIPAPSDLRAVATRADFPTATGWARTGRLRRHSTAGATSASLARRITSRSDPAGDGLLPTSTSTSSSDDAESSTANSSNGDSQQHKPSANDSSPLETPRSKYDHGWRRVVRNFSPSWFSVTMGTGVCSLLLITIPFKAAWLYWLSVFYFGLNSILFSIALILSLLRYTLYPQIWTVMVRDPNMVLFVSTFPMGFATLVESWIFLCCPHWGYWSVWVAWLAWMVDVVIAVGVTVSLPFLLMSASEKQGLERITAAQLLPIAATIIASGTGAEVAALLRDPAHALGTTLACYVLWGLATPLAMTVLVMYYQRLALHKLPPREVVVSCFLPLGPLGMGGYTITYLGKVSRTVFPQVALFTDLPLAGDIVYVLGIFVGLIMWGFGLAWLVFALATIYSTRPVFNMGWWGFTFPLGVYAISTMTFGVEFPSLFFKVLGTILAVAVILLWCVVAFGTARGAYSGELFYAVCLKNLPPEKKGRHVRLEERDLEKGNNNNNNNVTDREKTVRG